MSYVPNPSDSTEPQETRPARSAAAEFRALKSLVAALGGSSVGALVKSPKRQTQLSGLFTITTGTGLNANIQATNAVLSFADGMDTNGPKDLISVINGTFNNALTGIQPHTVNYLFADYVTPTLVNFGVTTSLPEYGNELHPRFLITGEAVTGGIGPDHLRDYFGATVTGSGAVTGSSSVTKYGSKSVHFPSAGSALVRTGFMYFRTPWTIEAWVRFSSFPTAGNNMVLFNIQNTATTLQLRLINTAGTLRLALDASSDRGTTDDIANAVLGTKSGASGSTWLTDQWYHIALCWSPTEGKMYCYVDGTVDMNISTTLAISPGTLTIGADAAIANGFVGYMDDIRILPACRYGSAAAFTPPTSQLNVEGTTYDIDSGTMYRFNGSSLGPGLATPLLAVRRVYIGEFLAGSSSISFIRTYANRGRSFTEFNLAAGSPATITHNLGYSAMHIQSDIKGLIESSVAGLFGGQVVDLGSAAFQDSSGTKGFNVVFQPNRWQASVVRAANIGAIRLDINAPVNIEAAIRCLLTLERSW